MPVKSPPGDHPLRRVFLDMIVWADANRGRSLQTTIGPSELGNACMRRLGYSLSGTVPINQGDPWFPIIGTAVHSWLADALNDYQRDVLGRDPLTNPRWLIEQEVWTGDPNCPSGHSDVFDLDYGTVVDWKIVGNTTRKKLVAAGAPSPEYVIQANTYGKGWKRAGRQVRQVMIVFLPRNLPLSNTVVWAAPFDESVADRALARLAAIDHARTMVQVPAMPTADGCTWCPFYRPHTATDLRGCAGHGR
jgi:hypothetical protein